MSYRKRYHEVIYGSKTVSYPASQDGGSKTVNWSEPIDIEIEVDTRAFDNQIDGCCNSVNMLTGSIVTTQAEAIKSKTTSSKK
jgi:hypothetical protein